MLISLLEDGFDLAIDIGRSCITVVLPAAKPAIGGEKYRSPLPRIGGESESLSHTVFDHHRPGDIGCPHEIVPGSSCHTVELDLLGNPATEKDIYLGKQFLFTHQISILGGALLGIAESGKPARNDGYFRVPAQNRGERRNQGVTYLMVGDDPFLLGINDPVFLFEPTNYPINGIIEIKGRHLFFTAAHGKEGAPTLSGRKMVSYRILPTIRYLVVVLLI